MTEYTRIDLCRSPQQSLRSALLTYDLCVLFALVDRFNPLSAPTLSEIAAN